MVVVLLWVNTVKCRLLIVKNKMLHMTGWLLLVMVLLSLLSTMYDGLSSAIPGLLIWVASVPLMFNISRARLKQALIIFGVGCAGLLIGWVRGADTQYLMQAVNANQQIIAMLISVSFLRLVAQSSLNKAPEPEIGVAAMLKTVFSAHILANVMNMSAIMIIGDRLNHHQPLNKVQAFAIMRGFSSCVCWSPFFAAMGVVMVSAPGAKLSDILLFQIPMALLFLGISVWQLVKDPMSKTSEGYPVTFAAMWLPALLSIIVLGAHAIWEDIPVVALVTLVSLMFTLIWALFFGGKKGVSKVVEHVERGVPKMAGEVLLFFGAAVLAGGVSATLTSFNLNLAPASFGAFEACVTLLIMVILSVFGMHPATSVVLAGSILLPVTSDPTLLAMTLLMGWSIGICFGPLSGVQLSLQMRYNIPSKELMRMNMSSCLPIMCAAFATLYLYTYVMWR
jgi:hypothetical protein